MHQELDPGLLSILSQVVGALEDPQRGLRDLEVVIEGDEFVQNEGVPGHDAESATDANFEASAAVFDAGDEAHIVNVRKRRVLDIV